MANVMWVTRAKSVDSTAQKSVGERPQIIHTSIQNMAIVHLINGQTVDYPHLTHYLPTIKTTPFKPQRPLETSDFSPSSTPPITTTTILYKGEKE